MSVATVDPPRTPPRLRIVPAPRPPDHDPAAGTPSLASAQDELPLEWVLPGGLPARPDLPLVLVRGGQQNTGSTENRADGKADGKAGDKGDDQDDFGPVPTPRAELPPPGPWAGRLVQALVEVVAGDRPIAQLVRWTDEEVYGQLRRLVSRAPRGHRTRASVRSVHVAEPRDGIAEVCAVVHDGTRARAYALRLEGSDGRWRCTDLTVG
ncbi:MAG TPA: Rv3235 family protein [Actinomycetes bacterium]|nr:Rv3235 family protein [Actinomycetes bacterium]